MVSMKKVAVVICAYNEEKTISAVVARSKKYSNEVIVVDDGSTDRTYSLVKGKCTVLRNRVNRGKGFTLRRGLAYAAKKGFKYVVIHDADGEDDPKYIPKMIKLLSKYDIVVASRSIRRSETRRKLNNFTNWWLRVATEYKIDDPCSGYNAFNLSALKSLNLISNNFECETEIVLEAKRNELSIGQMNVVMPYVSYSHLKAIHSLQINNFYDVWILKHVYGLSISFFKKIFLFFAALGGVVVGKPLEWMFMFFRRVF